MENFIQVFEGSDRFAKYIESYALKQRKEPDLSSREVSKAIFFHLIKMKLALLNHKKSLLKFTLKLMTFKVNVRRQTY